MSKFAQFVYHPAGQYSLLFIAGVLYGAVGYRSLAERPLWAYFTLIVIGLFPLFLFFTNRRIAHLFGLGVVMTLMAGVYLADALQVSDREQVIQITHELVRAVERADYAVFERYLDADFRWHNMNRAAMLNRVRTALLPNETRSCSVTSARVKEPEGRRNLTVEGNISASGQFGREEGFFSGTIEIYFTKQADGTFKATGTKVAWPGNGTEVTLPPGR